MENDMNNSSTSELVEMSNTTVASATAGENAGTDSVSGTTRKKAGRMASNIWSMFSDDANPQLKKAAVCKHCQVLVTYHKKSEYAQKHLNNCKAFKKIMMGTDLADRPEWFDSNKKSKLSFPIASTSAKSHCQQKAMTQYTLPPMTISMQAQFEETLALHYYVTGTAFQRVEEKNLARALHMLRPDVILPDRHKLAGPLLDKCYNKLKKNQDCYLTSPSSCVCLITDGWSNIKNEPIVNYMATSPDKTVFLESVATGAQGHTSQWIADDIERVIAKYKNTNFAGVVTDNTSANKGAWDILKSKHPTMFFHGCVSHGLHLMVRDIFSATKMKKSGQLEPTYPTGYPFEEMLQLALDCKDIVKFFNNHHAMKAKLKQMQQAEKLIALALPAPTRWGTLQQCFKSVLDSERIIYTIVNERNFVVGTLKQKQDRQNLKDIIVKDEFVSNLQKALKILQPIDALIVKFQGDNVPVSEVVTAFNQLPTKFAEMTDTLTSAEITYLQEVASNRFKLIYGYAHGIGYLLDPRFTGDGLPDDNRRDLEDVLVSIPDNDSSEATEDRKMMLFDQFTKYVISSLREKNEKTIRFKMLESRRKTPLQYWLSDGNSWPELQKIALRVFSMSASTAASERNFSTFGFIHSKHRNCLSDDSVRKLVFIKTNYNALVGNSTDGDYESDSDTDSDEPVNDEQSSSDESISKE